MGSDTSCLIWADSVDNQCDLGLYASNLPNSRSMSLQCECQCIESVCLD